MPVVIDRFHHAPQPIVEEKAGRRAITIMRQEVALGDWSAFTRRNLGEARMEVGGQRRWGPTDIGEQPNIGAPWTPYLVVIGNLVRQLFEWGSGGRTFDRAIRNLFEEIPPGVIGIGGALE